MNFASNADLYRDMTAWERQLPHFDAVCGVPRSGLLPASYIALRRNIRLVEINDLLREPAGAIARAPLRETNPIVRDERKFGNKLLIVDDSSSVDSVTFTNLRERLKDQVDLDISYGAVYRAAPISKVDYYFRELTLPRMFGWNWYRHWWLQFALLDMDGVLCEDWKGKEQDEPEKYQQHLTDAKPLFIPDVQVMAIVTSRLEKYRAQTVDWLTRNRVKYQKLIMNPAGSPQERQELRDHGTRKAHAYATHKDTVLFVESDIRQSKEIHELTGKPVLCIDTMEMLSRTATPKSD